MKLKAVYDNEDKQFAIYKEKKSGKYKYLFNVCKDLQPSLGIKKNVQCDIIYLELSPHKCMLNQLSKNQGQVEVLYSNESIYKKVDVNEHYFYRLGYCNYNTKTYYRKINNVLLTVGGFKIKNHDKDIVNLLDKFKLKRFFIKFSLIGVLDQN